MQTFCRERGPVTFWGGVPYLVTTGKGFLKSVSWFLLFNERKSKLEQGEREGQSPFTFVYMLWKCVGRLQLISVALKLDSPGFTSELSPLRAV